MSKQNTWDCKVALINDQHICYTGINNQECPAEIKLNDLMRALLTRFNYWIASDKLSPQRDDLELLGRLLYSILFPSAVDHPGQKLRSLFESDFRLFSEKRNEKDLLRLTLEIHRDARELSQLPWEFLFMPVQESGFFLAGEKTELILTRFVPGVPPELKVKKEEPLRILVIFSHPNELGNIGSKLTLDVIKQIKALEKIGKHIEVRIEENPTHKKLFDLMNSEKVPGDAAKNPEERLLFQPDIIHFIGHGEPGKLALMREPSAIEKEKDLTGVDASEVKWHDSKSIGELFNKQTPRLVFLHACDGAKASSVAGFSDLARDLVYDKVPVVVAMQYTIKNKDAAIFAASFYDEIRKGRRIDEAVQAGRASLGRQQDNIGGWSDRRFGTPVVYLQSKSDLALIERGELEPDEKVAPGDAGRVLDLNVKVPCPNPKCDGMLTLDSIECIVCDKLVMLCPGCEAKGKHFLILKETQRCGRCGHRPTGIRTKSVSAGEAVQSEKASPRSEDEASGPTAPPTVAPAPVLASLEHIFRPEEVKGG